MTKTRTLSSLLGAAGAAVLLAGGAHAQQQVTQNGIGPDRDGDGNPATNTRLMVMIGDAAEAALDPPFRVITFEAPPGGNGDIIRAQYAKSYGVTFSPGVKRQICQGRRYFRYDSQCTYLRAPSGKFAALYRDDWGRPLEIEFKKPVCAAALALYPTGGAEGERYRVTLQPYAADGSKLQRQRFVITWTQDTFRWRMMAAAYFEGANAARLDVNIQSLSDRKKIVRFLIDDVAAIKEGCVAPVDVAAGRPAKAATPVAPDLEPASGS